MPWAINSDKSTSSIRVSHKDLRIRPITQQRKTRPKSEERKFRIRSTKPPNTIRKHKFEISNLRESPSSSLYEQKSITGSRPATYSASNRDKRSFSIGLEHKEKRKTLKPKRVNLIDEILYNNEQDKES